MTSSFSLDAYLSRIGLPSSFASHPLDLDLLNLVQLSHLQRIAFENLDVVSSVPIDMSDTAVVSKLLFSRRGGYCFEMNTLLSIALSELGFPVIKVLARARWNRPSTMQTPLTHVVLVVTVPSSGDRYLVDVGFGGLQPLQALNLSLPSGVEQVLESCGTFRVQTSQVPPMTDEQDPHVTVQWSLNGNWMDLLQFRPDVPALQCDLEMGNFWSFRHPSGRWCSCLFAAIIVKDERHHILNDEYAIRSKDGKVVRRKMKDEEEVLKVLREVFGIDTDKVDKEKVRAFVDKGANPAFHGPDYEKKEN